MLRIGVSVFAIFCTSFPYQGDEDSEQVVKWKDERLRWKGNSWHHSFSINCSVGDPSAGSQTPHGCSRTGKIRTWRADCNECFSKVLKRRGRRKRMDLVKVAPSLQTWKLDSSDNIVCSVQYSRYQPHVAIYIYM